MRWCQEGSRTLTLWRRDGTGEVLNVPFRCKSWRCEDCRGWVGLQDYARVASALAERGPWVYAVLTLPGYWRGKAIWRAFLDAGDLWDRMRKRLTRRYGRMPLYVQTWEAHRDGYPHVNVVLGGEALIEEVEALGDGPEREHNGRPVRIPRWRTLWARWARECGFGRMTWVEKLWEPSESAPQPSDGLAGYMVKLAHNLGADRAAGAGAELVAAHRKGQTPLDAPRNFRRLRTSHRLLPPRHRKGEYTGRLNDGGAEWTWGDVDRYQHAQAEKLATALELLERSQALGLPLPSWTHRLLGRGHERGSARTEANGRMPEGVREEVHSPGPSASRGTMRRSAPPG